MKEHTFLNKAFIILIASMLCLQANTKAQEAANDKKEDKTAEIKNLVQSKNFVFVAQYANPLGRRNIYLTSVYDVRLSKDTLIADLPYFGRAYVAPMNPSEGGIHFTSTKFTYTVKPKKKGGWDITLMPKDTRDVRQMFLNISQDGYASLQVTSNNRQAISFTGNITSKDKFR